MRLLFALIATSTILFAGCGGGDDDTTRLDEDDAGRSVELAVGQTLEVVLDGNPTTGYDWQVDEVDAAILRQEGDADFDPDSDADGASGTVTLRFEAVAPGSTPLRLGYRFQNERDDPPNQSYEVSVTVVP